MRITSATSKDVIKATRPRDMYGNKSDNGRVAVIAGSSEYHGAPVLASNTAYNTLAALRIGVGYAYLYVPSSIINSVRVLSPTLIIRKFGRNDIGDGNFAALKKQLEKVDSVVIGMGLGRRVSTLRMSAKIIDYAVRSGKKVVVDADAIYSIRYVRKLNGNVVLTPQDREFEGLSGRVPDKHSLQRRITLSSALARGLHCSVLLKGHDTIITDGSSVKLIMSDSSVFATMGTGDVLAGIIGGYMAAGAGTFDAAAAGACVHSKVGDILHKKMGNHILSSDIVNAIPDLLKKFDINKKG